MNRRQAMCAFFALPAAAALPALPGRRQIVIEGDDVVLERKEIHGDLIFNGDRARVLNCTVQSEGTGVILAGHAEQGAVSNCAFLYKGEAGMEWGAGYSPR